MELLSLGMAQFDDGFGPHISTQYTFKVKHFKAKLLSTRSPRPFFLKKNNGWIPSIPTTRTPSHRSFGHWCESLDSVDSFKSNVAKAFALRKKANTSKNKRLEAKNGGERRMMFRGDLLGSCRWFCQFFWWRILQVTHWCRMLIKPTNVPMKETDS